MQRRNSEHLERRGLAAELAERRRAEQQSRLARLAAQAAPVSSVERDIKRLMAPTASVDRRRTACDAEPSGPRTSGYIRHVSARAVPAWRQPLQGAL